MSKEQSSQEPSDHEVKVGRRHFLKGAASSAAALAVAPTAKAQNPSAFAASYTAPTYQQLQRDTGALTPPAIERTVVRPGSDLMV